MSTPTPRTDANAGCLIDSEEVVPADFARELERELTALTAKRDQLRAELERVYALVTPVGFDLPGGIFETAQAVSELLTRAERAEAELAAERARLADLVADLNDACITLESAKNDCDDYAMQNTEFKLMAVRNVLLQYIPNAAIKEGAK